MDTASILSDASTLCYLMAGASLLFADVVFLSGRAIVGPVLRMLAR